MIPAAITLATIATSVLVVYALRRWVSVLDARLLLDDCIPHAQDVAAHEPAAVAQFGVTPTEKRSA